MSVQAQLQSDEAQLRKYRELAQMLRQWSDEPDDADWSVIEAEINRTGMQNCEEKSWFELSIAGLARAYSENEPDYSGVDFQCSLPSDQLSDNTLNCE